MVHDDGYYWKTSWILDVYDQKRSSSISLININGGIEEELGV